jgi:hypothetical protein
MDDFELCQPVARPDTMSFSTGSHQYSRLVRGGLDYSHVQRSRPLLYTLLNDFAFLWRHVLTSPYNNFTFRRLAIFHTDLYRSNVLVNSDYRIQKVIDWDNAFVAPWELVEFPKDFYSAPPSVLGPSYHEQESDQDRFREIEEYIRTKKREEETRKLDTKLSAVFTNPKVQELAQTCWLYANGKFGFYSAIFEQIDID